MEHVDVCIIGAGAAGLFCAIEAGRRGRRVILLDHAKKPAEKIRISGGGRCNFTNLEVVPERFWSRNPHFAKSALARYTQWDFIALVERHGIAWHEKTLGQLFCDGSAREIIRMLLDELADAGGDLRLGVGVERVEQTAEGFLVTTGRGVVCADRLVVACGGKSIPKMGATGFGHDIARQFGLGVVETRPGLVPLTFGGELLEGMKALAGVSVRAEVGCGQTRFAEDLLFTHRGLSGPAILQISSVWREGLDLRIDLLPGGDVAAELRKARGEAGRSAVRTALAGLLPGRLAESLLADLKIRGNLADQSDRVLGDVAARVHDWHVRPAGTEGYRTAEVTLGGVDTDDLNARTMEARQVPGLYFIGEVVDVTGWLGGYNFQWAWSSGWAAGQVV